MKILVLWIAGGLLVFIGMQQAYHKASSAWRSRASIVQLQKVAYAPTARGTYELHINRRYARSARIVDLMWYHNAPARDRLRSI